MTPTSRSIDLCPKCLSANFDYSHVEELHDSVDAATERVRELEKEVRDARAETLSLAKGILWDPRASLLRLAAERVERRSLSSSEPSAEDTEGVRGNSALREPSRGVRAHRRSDNMAPVAPPAGNRSDDEERKL